MPMQTASYSNVPPVAVFTYEQVAGTEYSFDGSGSTATSPNSVVNWSWDFGDATADGAGVAPSHTYSDLGDESISEYTVTLTVTDDAGLTDFITNTVGIQNTWFNKSGLLLLSPTVSPKFTRQNLLLSPRPTVPQVGTGMLLLAPSDTAEYVPPAGAEGVLMVPYNTDIITPASPAQQNPSLFSPDANSSVMGGNTYTKTGGADQSAWDSRAYSTVPLSPPTAGADWKVSYKLSAPDAGWWQNWLGLTQTDPSTFTHGTTLSAIAANSFIGFYPLQAGWYRVYEGSTVAYEYNSAAVLSAGTEISIERTSGVLTVSIDDSVVYTSGLTVSDSDVYIDSAHYKLNVGLTDISQLGSLVGYGAPAVKAPSGSYLDDWLPFNVADGRTVTANPDVGSLSGYTVESVGDCGIVSTAPIAGIGGGDFTIECVFALDQSAINKSGDYPAMWNYDTATGQNVQLRFEGSIGNKLTLWTQGTGTVKYYSTTFTDVIAGTGFHHYKYTRVNGVGRLFVDGVQQNLYLSNGGGALTTAPDTYVWDDAAGGSTPYFQFGRNHLTDNTTKIYFNECVITKATGETSNFTPPTTQYVPDKNTVFYPQLDGTGTAAVPYLTGFSVNSTNTRRSYEKTSGATDVFDARAFSQEESISSNWELQFSLGGGLDGYNRYGACGVVFSTPTDSTIHNDMDFSVETRTNVAFRAYEGATYTEYTGQNLISGDVFRIYSVAGVAKLQLNGVDVHTYGNASPTTGSAWAVATAYNIGEGFNSIGMNGDLSTAAATPAASWTDAQERSDKVYGKSGAVGQGVELEWTLARTTGFVIGLVSAREFEERPPSGNEVNKYSGLQVHHNGTEFIIYENYGDYYEAGNPVIADVTIPATIAIGDTVKIDANWGSEVRVLHNNVLIHTGSQTYPFHYDSVVGQAVSYPIDYQHRAISQNFESGDLYHSMNLDITP